MASTKRTRKPKASATSATETAATKTVEPTPAKMKTAKVTPETVTVGSVAKVKTQAIDIQGVIRFRAYELFEKRGYTHGYDVDDWLRAESEVLASFARSA